ncbi:MAG: anaerobic ribonucleoside-triphosphate reductase activating protein [Candidatus Wukongarchaeota archaeon]|nr:anaerobic ribonucleoside-triphosphate reductase activating protein [Candidatus Wukongarchaeota archaeon]
MQNDHSNLNESLEKKLYVGGFVDFSTVDIPGKSSAVIFLSGCNFDCPFCQNTNILSLSSGKLVSMKKIASMIEKNFLIEAVSITGGEPCIQESIIDLCRLLKNKGYYVNIDTNGSFPKMVKKLIGVIDKFSVDIKGPFERYPEISQAKNPNVAQLIKNTYHIINDSEVDFEVRTTVLSQLVWEKDVIKISEFLKANDFRGTYIIQQFFNSENVREPLRRATPPSAKEVLELAQIAKSKGLKKVGMRTRELGYQLLNP